MQPAVYSSGQDRLVEAYAYTWSLVEKKYKVSQEEYACYAWMYAQVQTIQVVGQVVTHLIKLASYLVVEHFLVLRNVSKYFSSNKVDHIREHLKIG